MLTRPLKHVNRPSGPRDEPPQSIGRLADPDSRSRQGRHQPFGRLEPDRRARIEQVETIVFAGYCHRLGEVARPLAEPGAPPPPAPHDVLATQCRSPTHQHPSSEAIGTTDNVGTPMDPIRPVHVKKTGGPEHDCVPRSRTPVAVAGGIVLVVGLNLGELNRGQLSLDLRDEPPTQQSGSNVECLAAEKGGSAQLRACSKIALNEWSRFSA